MTDWITATCETNGVDTHYIRTGGDKPPVVLLHGLTLNGACWIPLARTLAEDYDVIMPDARGHGYSSASDHGYGYDTLATDVVALIDTLKLPAPVLLGHSMGGMTAAVVANRRPQRLQGLILADPTFLTPERQREVYASDIIDQHRRILNRSREGYLAEVRVRHSRRSREMVERFAEARLQTSLHAFAILTPPNPDYVPLISHLEVPSLLIIGDVNAIVSPPMAADLLKLNQRLEVISIMDAGHGVPYDQPERFSAAVKTFLRSM